MINDGHKELPLSHKASEAALLFVIPHSAAAAYVWCHLADDTSLAGIYIAGAPLDIISRKKLVRPGNSLEILLVAGHELREGVACELEIATPLSEADLITAHAQLARWRDPNTQRAIRVIAGRFEPIGTPPVVLERFLAFASSWQAPCHIVAAFPEGLILRMSSPAHTALDAFCVTANGLLKVELELILSKEGNSYWWLEGDAPSCLYLDVDGHLVRHQLEGLPPSSDNFLTSFQENEVADVLTILHSRNVEPSDELLRWAQAVSPPRASANTKETTYLIEGAVHLANERLALFVEQNGTPWSHEAIKLESFGGTGEANITATVRESASGESKAIYSQAILMANASRLGGGPYRLSWDHAGRTVSIWLRGSTIHDSLAPGLSRRFQHVCEVSDDLFAQVIHPLATAPRQVAQPGLILSRDFGAGSQEVEAEIFIFCNEDLETAHRTLVALALTTRERDVRVHLCIFGAGLPDHLSNTVEEWSRVYNINVSVHVYTPRTSEALVANQAAGIDCPVILCRAGTVPPTPEWLSTILSQIDEEEADILLGWPAPTPHADETPIETADLEGTFPAAQKRLDSQLTAAALAPGLNFDILSRLTFFTLEAYLLAASHQAVTRRFKVHRSREMCFVRVEAASGPDRFEARLDFYSLQKMSGASSQGKRKVIKVQRRG